MNAVQMVLIVFIASLTGMEGILGQWQFHQPIISCTLTDLVTDNPTAGVMLDSALQLIAIGWANIGATIAPDATLAGVASAIIMIRGHLSTDRIGTAIGITVPLAVAGSGLTMIVRILAIAISHIMDKGAERANYQGIELWQLVATGLQGLRIAIPAALLLAIPPEFVKSWFSTMPVWLSAGMTIGDGMVVAVGYAMIINMMASKEIGPFFAIGFALAAIQDLILIVLGATSAALALMYLTLEGRGSNNSGSEDTGDPLGDILDNY